MKIALINEISQSPKNELICSVLTETVRPLGHTVHNYGMYSQNDSASLSYIQNGILAAILVNSGAADFIVTGCGTGMGAMIALNSFPGLLCGFAADPADAFLFTQINNGNAISLPFAKGFGWGAELNLAYLFDKLFAQKGGCGYPTESAQRQELFRGILDTVRANTMRPLLDCLSSLDEELVRGAVAGERFKELFFDNCKDDAIADFVRKYTA